MQALLRAILAALLTPLAVALAQPTFPYVLRTVAGSSPLGDGGPATAAVLNRPEAVAVDSKGNMYIGSRWSPRIRKVSPSGTISTFAEVTATDLLVDRSDNIYASDGTAYIYRITPSGAVSVLAGTGVPGFNGDGPATSTQLASPGGMALHTNGDLYFADMDNHRIRRVDATGRITTVAGTGTAGYNGDGAALSVQLNWPRALAFDASNNLYIADTDNCRIRKMDPSGLITTYAGNGQNWGWDAAGDGGAAIAAPMGYPMGLAVDSAGNLYVSCNVLSRVRVIDRSGVIRAYAGNGIYGYAGDGGQATAARLAEPLGLVLDRDGSLLIADNENHRVRRVSAGVISTVAGASHYGGDNGPATSALLDWPDGVAVDRDGTVYIADMGNNRIRKVAPNGAITTYAGTGENGVTGDNGPATSAQLSLPQLLALDSAGNLYSINQDRVRKISKSGIITTTAQNKEIGDPRPTLQGPPSILISAIATDAQGNLYFAESWPVCRVRKLTPEGQISQIVGAVRCGYGGDGGPAIAAQISIAWNMVVDKNGDLYIADTGNNRVRKVTSDGKISTFVGNGRDQAPGPTPQPAAGASIGSPMGIAIDEFGDLYVSDNNAPTIAKVSGGMVYRIAGNDDWLFRGDGVPALSASVGWATQLAAGSGRDIYLVDEANSRVHQLILNSPSRLEIAGGDNQTVNPGETLPRSLSVKLTGRAGVGVENTPVAFAVTAGDATLSASTATTDKSGLASAGLTAGRTAGTVTVTATASGLAPVKFTITVRTSVSPDTPRIASGGVTGAGLSVPPVRAVSPNAIVTIWGENFAPPGSAPQTAAPSAGQVPTKVAGLCVRFNDLPAPIYLVAPNQANVIVPKVAVGAEVSVQVIRNCGEANELRSNVEKVAARLATPEFLFFVARADGKSPIAGFNVSRAYAYLGAPGLVAGATFVPARPGDWLELYGVGWGATDPAVEPGVVPGMIAPTAGKVKVSIGGLEVAEQDLYYAGASPAIPGLYQLNVRLPAAIPDGDQAVSLQVAGESTPAGAYITVRRE
jgi:uncharacterized protein (TIGR03437 family)